jgi:hypothetical protein
VELLKKMDPAVRKAVESRMENIKVSKPKKSKGNMCCPWDSSMEKPGFNINSKHLSSMPELKPGDTVQMMVECTVKCCEINEDKSTDYRMEMNKAGLMDK